MKANDVYKAAVAYFFEKPGYDRDFYDNFLPLLGGLLQEALPYENSIRRTKGEGELAHAPVIESMEEEIGYDEGLCRVALPFGIASYFYQDEVDNFKAQDFRGRYINALQEAARWSEEPVEDVYGYGEVNG